MVIPLPARSPARAASRNRGTGNSRGTRRARCLRSPAPGAKRPTRELAGGPPVSAPLFGLAPCGVCQAAPVTRGAGGLLPHRFTLTATEGLASRPGGLFSVALSFPSPGLGVTQRNALWSSDFPLPGVLRAATIRLAPTRPNLNRDRNDAATWPFRRPPGRGSTPVLRYASPRRRRPHARRHHPREERPAERRGGALGP